MTPAAADLRGCHHAAGSRAQAGKADPRTADVRHAGAYMKAGMNRAEDLLSPLAGYPGTDRRSHPAFGDNAHEGDGSSGVDRGGHRMCGRSGVCQSRPPATQNLDRRRNGVDEDAAKGDEDNLPCRIAEACCISAKADVKIRGGACLGEQTQARISEVSTPREEVTWPSVSAELFSGIPCMNLQLAFICFRTPVFARNVLDASRMRLLPVHSSHSTEKRQASTPASLCHHGGCAAAPVRCLRPGSRCVPAPAARHLRRLRTARPCRRPAMPRR